MNLREPKVVGLAAIAIALLLSPRYTAGQGEPTQRRGPGWPQWRGPRQDAVSEEAITLWPPVKLWETNVGYGVSSPIALGGRVLAMGHRDGEDTVWCLDAQTGQVLWKHPYPAKSDQTSDVRFPGPRSTPATDGACVYTLSLEGRLHCLDATNGKVLWRREPDELGADKRAQYGICCPVTLWGRMVIVDVSGTIVALDKISGRELWRNRGGRGWNGAAPVVVQSGSRSYVLHGTGRCLDAETGRLLWSVPYGEWSVATPAVLGDCFFLAPFHGRSLGVPKNQYGHAASPALCDDLLFVQLDQDEPQDKEISTADLGEPCPGVSPAFVEGRIFIRAEKHLYCIAAPIPNPQSLAPLRRLLRLLRARGARLLEGGLPGANISGNR